MKYVILAETDGLPERPVLFSTLFKHKEFKRLGDIVSAGFVRFDSHGRPHAYGESDSLQLRSREFIDTEIIREACEQQRDGATLFEEGGTK